MELATSIIDNIVVKLLQAGLLVCMQVSQLLRWIIEQVMVRCVKRGNLLPNLNHLPITIMSIMLVHVVMYMRCECGSLLPTHHRYATSRHAHALGSCVQASKSRCE